MIKTAINAAVFLIGVNGLFVPVMAGASQPNQTPELSVENRILEDINQYRAAHGLNPLRMNAEISKEAAIHSKDMANHTIPFGHVKFPERTKNLSHKFPSCRGTAENVAFNYKDIHFLVQEWIKSPGHKKNIIGNYNLTGIGVAQDNQGKMYYTQLFIKADG